MLDSHNNSTTTPPAQVRGVRRLVYLMLATLFLGLGLLGVVLPGLPTTPFLLLMSFFLYRSSPWLHDRVVRIPVAGRPIQDWRERRGVRPGVKWIASLMVLAVVGLSLGLRALSAPLMVAIVLLASIGVAVVWQLPTIRE